MWALPPLVVLDCIKKADESEPGSRVASWPLLQFLPPGASLELLPLCPFVLDYDWADLVMVFITTVGSKGVT